MTRSLKLRTAYGQCSRALHGALGNSMHDGDISLILWGMPLFWNKAKPIFFALKMSNHWVLTHVVVEHFFLFSQCLHVMLLW